MTASLLHRIASAFANWRRRHHVLAVTKDGGPESTVWAHWLFEFKGLGSIVLLRFEHGSRDAYHSHAFDCVSWMLAGSGLVEHRIGGPGGAPDAPPYVYTPSALPIITRRAHLHKVISLGRTWVLSFRGPWAREWEEHTPVAGGAAGDVVRQRLANGRKEIEA
jgi:hypothetical protein